MASDRTVVILMFPCFLFQNEVNSHQDGRVLSSFSPYTNPTYFHPISLPYPVPLMPGEGMHFPSGAFQRHFPYEGPNQPANSRKCFLL